MKEFFYEPSECPLPNKGTINEMYIVFNFLRMLPTFATAYTFCASRDGPRGSDFLRQLTILLIQKYFLRGL